MNNIPALKKIPFLLFAFLVLVNAACSQTPETKKEIKPTGAFSEISLERQKHAFRILHEMDDKLKKKMMDSVMKHPNVYIPPILYLVAAELMVSGKEKEAPYWFYTGQLRARIDANLCTDESAKQAVSTLNQTYGPIINEYAFKDLKKLEKTVKKVCEFVRKNPEQYDRRWIALYGMDAMRSGLEGQGPESLPILPEDQWAKVKTSTIDGYYKDFETYVLKKAE